VSAAGWWEWWEFNKLAWSRPNRIGEHVRGEEAYRVSEELHGLRRLLRPILVEGTRDEQAAVRAAALIALARAFGEEALDTIEERLADPSPDVRRSAILALGATRSERGVHRLLQIASPAQGGEGESITPRSRALSLVALGLAREQGVGQRTARFLPGLRATRGAAETDQVGNALILHQALVPSAELEPVARELTSASGDLSQRASIALVARGVEALRFERSPDPALLSELLSDLERRDLEIRRSLACTLAAIGMPGTGNALQSAFEAEREGMTRGFQLVALGHLGGSDARDFLMHVLESGDRTARPWCALALGILAREADDDIARTALRVHMSGERNQESLGAFLLAAGIALDRQAVEEQVLALERSASGRTRMHAALALSMGKEARAVEALRGALATESTPLVRIVIAQALAHVGEARDVPLLLGVLGDLVEADYQPQVAAAFGSHGSLEMLRALAALLEGDELRAIGRAAAVQAVGILLDEARPFRITELCQRANFMVFPDWLYEPVLTTL
jgi:HEAT repeat protein